MAAGLSSIHHTKAMFPINIKISLSFENLHTYLNFALR